MTREEAIRELKADYCGNRIICELYPDQCNREDCEIWLAIKALETQPDGDAVSRKDAIRIVDSIDTWQAGWRGNAIESLKALPSAQPEVAKDTNVLINDCISRQAAIDAANEWLLDCFKVQKQDRSCGLIRRLEDLPSAQPEYDCVLKQFGNCSYDKTGCSDCEIKAKIRTALSAQPKPLSNAYTKTVWTWLLDYQIKAAELKGRYTPYEVLSWVANDWRKEHEGSD